MSINLVKRFNKVMQSMDGVNFTIPEGDKEEYIIHNLFNRYIMNNGKFNKEFEIVFNDFKSHEKDFDLTESDINELFFNSESKVGTVANKYHYTGGSIYSRIDKFLTCVIRYLNTDKINDVLHDNKILSSHNDPIVKDDPDQLQFKSLEEDNESEDNVIEKIYPFEEVNQENPYQDSLNEDLEVEPVEEIDYDKMLQTKYITSINDVLRITNLFYDTLEAIEDRIFSIINIINTFGIYIPYLGEVCDNSDIKVIAEKITDNILLRSISTEKKFKKILKKQNKNRKNGKKRKNIAHKIRKVLNSFMKDLKDSINSLESIKSDIETGYFFKKKTYSIAIEEVISQNFEVEATSEYELYHKIRKLYFDGILELNNPVITQVNVQLDPDAEWVELC